MGIYVEINGTFAKGYEISFLEEVIERLKNGEENFTINGQWGQGDVEVKTY